MQAHANEIGMCICLAYDTYIHDCTCMSVCVISFMNIDMHSCVFLTILNARATMSPVRVFIRKDAPSTFLSLVLSYDCRCLWILLCRRCRDTNTPCPQISWKSFKNVGMAYEVPQINSSMIRKVRFFEGGHCYIVWMISNADRLAQMRNWLV